MKVFRDGTVTFVGTDPVMKKYLETGPRRRVEREIAGRLLARSQPNVVDVYDVSEDCVVQELLEPLDEYDRDPSGVMRDVLSGLSQLHSIGVVYVDLHDGNVGWSERDSCWKLFDFNMSGTVADLQTWDLEPSPGLTYDWLKKQPVKSLFQHDERAAERFRSALAPRHTVVERIVSVQHFDVDR